MENENSNMENENQSENSWDSRFETPQENVPSPMQYTPQMSDLGNPKKHMGLAVASLILSALSLICCWIYCIGIIPALIGTALGLVATIKGKGSVRIMGIVGLVMGLVGTALSLFMIITYISIINWDNVTIDKLGELQYIDSNDRDAVMRWMQQFFSVDISAYGY